MSWVRIPHRPQNKYMSEKIELNNKQEAIKRFIYRDNSKREWVYPKEGENHGSWVSPIIFECEAGSIDEADTLFEEKLGLDVRKSPDIGCSNK